jgi:hypothetical protein
MGFLLLIIALTGAIVAGESGSARWNIIGLIVTSVALGGLFALGY